MHNKNCRTHKTTNYKEKVSYLESLERKAELSAEKLLNLIPIKENDNVLDLGAGTGYFTIPLANRVAGTVYALDTDANMLEIIEAKAIEEHVTNIMPIQGEIADFPFTDTPIDVVLASLVLHEINPLEDALDKIRLLLKEEGYLICVELEPKAASMHKAPRISSIDMEQAIMKAGLRIIGKSFPTGSLYVLIAQK